MVQSVLIAIAGLWPLIAFAGGLGFAPLLLLAALLCARTGAPRMRFQFYMFAIFATLEYFAASARWSPREISLVDIDFATGEFAVRFEVLRVGMGLLWTAMLMEAAKTLTQEQAERVVGVAATAMLIQLVIVALLAMFEHQALALFAPLMSSSGEGVQNISRNGIIMALASPYLIVGLGRRLAFRRALIVEVCVFVAITGVLLTRGVHGGIVSVVAGLFSVGVVRIFPRQGFRILAVLLALVIVSAPIVFGWMSAGATGDLAATSAEWRLAIWARVIELIGEDPIFGQGLGVLRTIDEHIETGALAGQLLVPNHAHNMVLQLWAEGGAIGASLLAATLIFIGFRMPEPRRLGVAGFLAAALAGQFMAIALVSFDAWNDWWWAAAGLLAVLTVVMWRAETPPPRALPAPSAHATRHADD